MLMKFKFGVDPKKYGAERFGIKPKASASENAETATEAMDEALAQDEETVDTPISECRAQNPLTCRYHGAQLVKLDILQHLQRRLPGVNFNVNVERINDSGRGGVRPFEATIQAPDGTDAEAIKQAVRDFLHTPGIDAGDEEDIEDTVDMLMDTMSDEEEGNQGVLPLDIDELNPQANTRAREAMANAGKTVPSQQNQSQTPQPSVSPLGELRNRIAERLRERGNNGNETQTPTPSPEPQNNNPQDSEESVINARNAIEKASNMMDDVASHSTSDFGNMYRELRDALSQLSHDRNLVMSGVTAENMIANVIAQRVSGILPEPVLNNAGSNANAEATPAPQTPSPSQTPTPQAAEPQTPQNTPAPQDDVRRASAIPDIVEGVQGSEDGRGLVFRTNDREVRDRIFNHLQSQFGDGFEVRMDIRGVTAYPSLNVNSAQSVYNGMRQEFPDLFNRATDEGMNIEVNPTAGGTGYMVSVSSNNGSNANAFTSLINGRFRAYHGGVSEVRDLGNGRFGFVFNPNNNIRNVENHEGAGNLAEAVAQRQEAQAPARDNAQRQARRAEIDQDVNSAMDRLTRRFGGARDRVVRAVTALMRDGTANEDTRNYVDEAARELGEDNRVIQTARRVLAGGNANNAPQPSPQTIPPTPPPQAPQNPPSPDNNGGVRIDDATRNRARQALGRINTNQLGENARSLIDRIRQRIG